MNRNILIMKQKTLLLVFACFLFLASGCSFFSAERPKDTIKIYTTLDKNFVEALCDSYCKGLPADQKLAFAVTDKDAEESQADCILGSVSLLRQKAAEGSLQKLQADCADLLPDVLKDREERWTVLFYDPAVLLVNHEYSRKAGKIGDKSPVLRFCAFLSYRPILSGLWEYPSFSRPVWLSGSHRPST